MKSYRFLVVLLLVIIVTASTTEAGENALEFGCVSLGGSMSFQTMSSDLYDENVNSLLLAPNALVYLFDGFAVGAELAFLRLSEGDYSSGTHRYTGMVQYVLPLESVVNPFIHGGFGFIRVSEDDGESQHSENGYTFKIGLGLYTFLNEHFALKGGADFIRDTLLISEGNDPSTSTMLFYVGFEGFIY